MKKIVGLLAMLALVFVLAGCPDPVNPPASVPEAGTSDPVPSVPAGETYEIVLDGTYTATVNTYGSDPKGETQVKIPTNISGLKVGDKVVLKMKGTASYEVPFIEICLADTSEAAGWWMMLDEAKYEDEAVTEFDIEHTFTVTTAPKTGAEIVINGKGSRDTLTLDCTPKADDGEGEAGDDNVGTEGTEPEAPAVIVLMANEAGYTNDWAADDNAFTADKFKDAVSGSAIVFTISKNTDQYYDGDYDDCYSLIQLLDGEAKLASGTLEGGIKSGVDLKPQYLNADGTDNYDETAVYKMTYYPSDDEIAVLKDRGVKVQAHGTKIYKIEFVPVA